MSDSRDNKLLGIKMEEDIDRSKILEKTFEKLAEMEKTTTKQRTEAIEKMKRINDLDNNTVKKMFSTVAFSLENIEKYRNQFASDIEANILPAIKYYPTKIEELKENLEELNKFATDINKKTNNLTAAKQTGEMNKINQITNELSNTKNEELKKSDVFENKTAEYEIGRLEDNKAFLLHYIHSRMAFHTKSLESFTRLYSEINNYEPKGELHDFAKKYSILKDMNEQQLSQRFDFTPGITEKKKGKATGKAEKKETKKKVEDEDI